MEDIELTAGFLAVNVPGAKKKKHRQSRRNGLNLLPALVAVGGACGLVAMPVSALELGEIQVNSTLGQPLRASIAYALNPNEQIFNYCIYLRAGMPGGNMSPVNDVRISIADGHIVVSGRTPIREPMLNMQVAVDCAYTPHLLREYTLMINPRASLANVQPVIVDNGRVDVAGEPAAEIEQVRRPTASRTPVDQSPVAVNSTYRVQPGETISTIVARIENRDIGLWRAVDIVFAANPDAFVSQDVNRLMSGSDLIIPALTQSAVPQNAGASGVVPAAESRVDSEPVHESAATSFAATGETEPLTVAPVDTINPSATIEFSREISLVEELPAQVNTVSELQPGDIVIPEPATADQANSNTSADSASPNNTVTSGAWNWLIWLVGSGIALFLGLLLFGRKLKTRFGSMHAGTPAPPVRRQDDDATRPSPIITDVDLEFEDAINAQAISLDADLGAGTGLGPGSSMDVAEDFGFSASGQIESELDMDFTDDSGREPEASPTDIIAPSHRAVEPSILDQEEPPSDDDGEYDLSMIVDATKQSVGEYDATAQDLKAVRVEAYSATEGADDDYTLSSAADYSVLEQDYQEEFTATLAANAELEKAAIELASRMDDEESESFMAEVPDLDVTCEMPAADTEVDPFVDAPATSDLDVTAEIATNLPTSIEAENDSIAGNAEEFSVETTAGSDITIDMPRVSGKKAGARKK